MRRGRVPVVLALVLVAAPFVSAYEMNEECRKLCAEGLKHEKAHEYEEAAEWFDKARKADPRSGEAQRMYGVCIGDIAGTTDEQKATWNQAIAEWEKVLTMEDASAETKGIACGDLGNCHLNIKKQPDKALKYYKKGVEVSPEDGDLWLLLAVFHWKHGEKWQEALDCTEKAIKFGVQQQQPEPDYLNKLRTYLKGKVGEQRQPASIFASTFPVPSPGGVATTADLATLIVSVPTTAQLVYLDTAEVKESKRVSLEFQPGSLAIQGKTLFAAAKGTPKLFALDLDSGKVQKTIKLPAALSFVGCHRSKGLVYGLATSGEVVSIDPASGRVTTCQAKGSLLAVDPVKPGTVYVATADPKGDKTPLRRYTANGSDLKLADTNDDAAVHGCCLDLTVDGKRIALLGTGGFRDRGEGVKGEAVAVFETEKLTSMAGLLDAKGSPRALAFHPALDLGIALTDKSIIQFSSKSLVHVKDWPYETKTTEPRFLAFVDGGKKLASWEPGDASKKEDGALRFLALQLTADDEAALTKALGKGH